MHKLGIGFRKRQSEEQTREVVVQSPLHNCACTKIHGRQNSIQANKNGQIFCLHETLNENSNFYTNVIVFVLNEKRDMETWLDVCSIELGFISDINNCVSLSNKLFCFLSTHIVHFCSNGQTSPPNRLPWCAFAAMSKALEFQWWCPETAQKTKPKFKTIIIIIFFKILISTGILYIYGLVIKFTIWNEVITKVIIVSIETAVLES